MISCQYCGENITGNALIEKGVAYHPHCKVEQDKTLAETHNIRQVFPNIKEEFFDKWEEEHGDCYEIEVKAKKYKGVVRYACAEHGISSYTGYDNNEIMEKEVRNAVNHPEEQGFPELIIWEGCVYDLVITPFNIRFVVDSDYNKRRD